MFCTHCGSKLTEGSRFCIHCGAPQNTAPAPAAPGFTPPTPAPEPIPAPEPEPVPAWEPVPASEPVPPVKAEAPQEPEKPEKGFVSNATEVLTPEMLAAWDQVSAPVGRCSFCGQPLKNGGTFCIHCGRAQPGAAVPPVMKPRKKKGKKGLVIALVCVLAAAVLGVAGWFGYGHLTDYLAYQKACELMEKDQPEQALEAFEALEDFRDSQTQVEKLRDQIRYLEGKEALEEGYVYEALELFTELEYMDSQELAQQAQSLIESYEAAAQLLEQGCLEEAEAAFREISFVENSDVYLSYDIPLARAQALIDGADSRSQEVLKQFGETEDFTCVYQEALKILESLDSSTLQKEYAVSQASLGLCLLYIQNGDSQAALEYAEGITDPDHLSRYQEAQKEQAELEQFLKAWEDSLKVRTQWLKEEENYYCTDELKTVRANIETFPCPDETLKALAVDYMAVIEEQLGFMTEAGRATDHYAWLSLELRRYEILETLNQSYGFLNGNEALKKEYIGRVPFTKVWLEVERSFQEQFSGATLITGQEEAYVLSFQNPTAYEISMEVEIFFLDAEENVLQEESYTFTVKPQEITDIPLTVPEHEYWGARYRLVEVQFPEET